MTALAWYLALGLLFTAYWMVSLECRPGNLREVLACVVVALTWPLFVGLFLMGFVQGWRK